MPGLNETEQRQFVNNMYEKFAGHGHLSDQEKKAITQAVSINCPSIKGLSFDGSNMTYSVEKKGGLFRSDEQWKYTNTPTESFRAYYVNGDLQENVRQTTGVRADSAVRIGETPSIEVTNDKLAKQVTAAVLHNTLANDMQGLTENDKKAIAQFANTVNGGVQYDTGTGKMTFDKVNTTQRSFHR